MGLKYLRVRGSEAQIKGGSSMWGGRRTRLWGCHREGGRGTRCFVKGFSLVMVLARGSQRAEERGGRCGMKEWELRCERNG